jgi:hypothetical protein
MGFNSAPGGGIVKAPVSKVEEIEIFKSLKEVREKFGTLISKIGTGTGFHDEAEVPYFMITTTSKGSRGPEGSAFIDIKLGAEQAQKLFNDLKSRMEDINKMPATENVRDKYYGEKTELAKARDEFGTLSIKNVMANAFDDYKGLGPKVLLITTAEGKRGPKGDAPIDMAISAEDAKELYKKLEEDMDAINKRLETK